ncbi:phosphate ABC transporter permease subunit PstC [Puia dinghuensis]|uniref:Phosphate transport system permease protein n=1 Tax=Puia dinghuensis TaxID=1792502 RepID=A0A8J2UFD1_9BACT|nr:phosphate ABC transporter permease subunit PstC [Puia dinghuensis]GGB07511.1 phosphate transport system permease protein [Puia dinghuensis]
MDTSVDNGMITRSDIPLRVINSSPEAILKAKKRTKRSFRQIRTENVFRHTLTIMGLIMVILVLGIMLTLAWQSRLSISTLGPKYLWSKVWDPVQDIYGAWPFLLGTLLTSFLALIISVPFSVSVAIFLGEYHPKGWLPDFLKNAVELIAAVPSVIYGFWALEVLVPYVRKFESAIGVEPVGVGIFSSSLILAVMIIPYAASLGRSMISLVPSHLKEAAYALGATRWEVIRTVVLPYTKSGLFAGILLSLGRALGETMAVTMVIGNTSLIPKNIFAPGNTMASVIANEFTEADKPVYLSALIELGLVLFLVTVVINLIGKKIIDRFTND